jgi:hypothetical protein
MHPFALVWCQLRAAQQRVRETFEPSALPSEASHLNSSPTVAEPDGGLAVGEVGSTSTEATFKRRS